MRQEFKKDPADVKKWAEIFGIDSKCIASDDPRLKASRDSRGVAVP
jgi:hypothetical protein